MPTCVLKYTKTDGTTATMSGASKAEVERVIGPMTDDAYIALMASRITTTLRFPNLEVLVIPDSES